MERPFKLERCLISLITMSLRRILGYRWQDYMSNDLVLRGAGLRQVTCIVCERQPLVWACGTTPCGRSRPFGFHHTVSCDGCFDSDLRMVVPSSGRPLHRPLNAMVHFPVTQQGQPTARQVAWCAIMAMTIR